MSATISSHSVRSSIRIYISKHWPLANRKSIRCYRRWRALNAMPSFIIEAMPPSAECGAYACGHGHLHHSVYNVYPWFCFYVFFFCFCVAICHRQCRRLSKFQMITRTFFHFISDKKLRSNEKPSMRMVKRSGTPKLSSMVPHATQSKWLVRGSTQIGSRVRCKRRNEEK